MGSHRVESLTIPVHSKNDSRYSDVKIDYSQNWLKAHLRTIQSAYSNAPYFEHYFPLIEQILQRKYEYLTHLNREIMTLCLRLLSWQKEILCQRGDEQFADLKLKDYRNRVSIKKKNCIIESILGQFPYQQLFGNKFVPNLSILDLLFNEGVEASDYFPEDSYNKLI